MPHCTSCGSHIESTHRHCGSCGSDLTETTNAKDGDHAAIERDGFLSPQSVSYLADAVNSSRHIDRESPAHHQLQHEVRDALADFSLLTKVEDLHLIRLWASAIDRDSLEIFSGDLGKNQRQDILAAQGIRALLRFYDESLGTEFCAEYDDRISNLEA